MDRCRLAAGMGQVVEICVDVCVVCSDLSDRAGELVRGQDLAKPVGLFAFVLCMCCMGFVVCSQDIISQHIASEDELVYVHWISPAMRLWNGTVLGAFALGVHACSTCGV